MRHSARNRTAITGPGPRPCAQGWPGQRQCRSQPLPRAGAALQRVRPKAERRSKTSALTPSVK